jgi:uncharacterized DUF497 family protein
MDEDPDFAWDDAKAARNLAERGLGFEAIRGLDWENCRTREDTRGAYGERRFISIGMIGGRLHVAVWTPRDGKRRLISLRKANERERALHDQA